MKIDVKIIKEKIRKTPKICLDITNTNRKKRRGHAHPDRAGAGKDQRQAGKTDA